MLLFPSMSVHPSLPHRQAPFGPIAGAGLPGGPRSVNREAFDRLLGELRPKLHRYCARMTGSVIDGEDVVQEALLIEALPETGSIAHPEAWLFRIAHNAALDYLRRRARRTPPTPTRTQT
jgi:DNA-directed RNA polymerase specialized sigma24 family protein